MGHAVRLTYHLRPYLADYLRHRYGTITEPLPASLRCEESPLVLYLNCTVSPRLPDSAQVERFARGRATYTIPITPRRARRYGRFITVRGQRNFERLVYVQFMHELIAHIDAHKRHSVQALASIIDFMLANGINPHHIDAEDLARVVYNVRQRAASRFSAPTVPAPPAPPPAPSSAR